MEKTLTEFPLVYRGKSREVTRSDPCISHAWIERSFPAVTTWDASESVRCSAVILVSMRRYFYDTEFIEDGTTIDLVSIGVVDETGREFYAISTEFNPDKAIGWVRDNVLAKLPSPADSAWRSRLQIRDELLAFLTEPGERIELWAWFAAYDHVALCQLWGSMPVLPRPIPRMTKELRQRWDELGRPKLPEKPADAHDALVDARFNLVRWQAMEAAQQNVAPGA